MAAVWEEMLVTVPRTDVVVVVGAGEGGGCGLDARPGLGRW